MKNLIALKTQEIKNINGGNHNPSVMDDGNGGGCTGGPIIVIGPTTGPTFPDPDTIFGF
ncbi:hypothetical protein [uncultured Aquimarina sp.]|uniref:hypothetical protein n=1 Tax=uncultured Aquimarina sp. TaxID=575652 RepID=UPI002627207A|nr:hypothetical protein [uncultured Aquimarina sp.]